ncbi:hypothetical protein KSP39_PZI021696 [Platanthera zijinensis]|uniref:Uncharacterized protein n=1 Tax=Platanthera zijinensis TaxID=2320716 RepID=A0AAP0AXB4_9ASPA
MKINASSFFSDIFYSSIQHHSWKILVEVFLNTCQHVILSVKCMLLAGPLEQTFLCYWQDMGRKVPTQELMTRDMHGVEWPIFFGWMVVLVEVRPSFLSRDIERFLL